MARWGWARLPERPPLGRRAAILAAPSLVAGAYMSLPTEPDRWMAVAGLLAATTLAAACWRAERLRWPGLWLLAVALGFVWAMLRADIAATPTLEREGSGALAGVAAWIEAGDKRPRLVLTDVRFERYGRTAYLKRARVRLGSGPRPEVGDRVSLRAVMRPPPPAVAPGAFDFRRDAYFKGIGAVGFAIGPARVWAEPARGLAPWFGRLRTRFRDVVYRALPDRPEIAGIVAALTVGDRSGVAEADNVALRASGLAHLLAISGLHLGMAAAVVYLMLRLALALPHGLALRFPVHKVAAAAAILAAAVYLGLSGAAPPAQRAFVMAVAAMIAIMTDRLRSGLWFVAWAAVGVTVVAPHVVTGPSFQLSFAAATAIVAAFEGLTARRRLREEPAFAGLGPARPMVTYVGGIAMASLIATAATAPLALAHFQQAPAFGVVANLAAMPAMGFIIMPFAIVAGALSLVGLADLPLAIVGFGVEIVLAVAHWVAGWPVGVIRAPASPDWVVAAFLAGGALVCILRGWPRWLGLAGPVAAAVGLALATPPDLLAAESGGLAAVVDDGRLYVTSTRSGRFEREVWARHVAAEATLALKAAPGNWARCDDRGCVATVRGAVVAISTGMSGLKADCRRADFVLVLHDIRPDDAMTCRRGAVAIDRRDLARDGAHAIRLGGRRPAIESVREAHGGRVWSGWREFNRRPRPTRSRPRKANSDG